MITINLTPVEELENPYWWIPDVGVLLLVVSIGLGGVFFYIHTIQSEIALSEAEKSRLIEETNALSPNVEKYNSLNTKISALDSKKVALQRITESKLIRYLPIILLENIQNLKPDGVWLNSLVFVDKRSDTDQAAPPPPPENTPEGGGAQAAAQPTIFDNLSGRDFPITIEINGGAMNNVLIADFMMALKATQNQSFEKSDLRTQLFFSDVGISFSQIVSNQQNQQAQPVPPQGQAQAAPRVVPPTVSFKLQLNFRERQPGTPENNSNFSQFIEKFRRDGQASMN